MNNSNKDYLEFDGNIIYHKSIETTNQVLSQLLTDLMTTKIVVGFDCEWNAFPRPSKVCLIQLCFDANDSIDCHLFHISEMNYLIPPLLESLLLNQNCLKVGLNIEADFWKLQRDYKLPFDSVVVGDTKSLIDLSVMANKLFGKNENWSLSRLAQFLLKRPIRKELRLSNWSRSPLTSEQQRYAAIDAFASYQLYFEIKTNAKPFDCYTYC